MCLFSHRSTYRVDFIPETPMTSFCCLCFNFEQISRIALVFPYMAGYVNVIKQLAIVILLKVY